MPFPELRNQILRVDMDKLDEQLLKQFINIIPNKEDVEMLLDFQKRRPDDVKRLGKAETFILEV